MTLWRRRLCVPVSLAERTMGGKGSWSVTRKRSVKGEFSVRRCWARSSVSEPAYLRMVTVVAFTIAVIVGGEVNHLNHLLWRGQDLPYGGEVVVVVVVVGIKNFSILRELGRASRWEWLADSWWRLKATAIHRRRYVHRRQIEASGTAEYSRIWGGWRFRELKAQVNGGCVGIAVGDRLRARGRHRNQVAYSHERMSRLRKRSGGGHVSWMRGRRCSSKGGIAWELYRRKTAVFSEGLGPR